MDSIIVSAFPGAGKTYAFTHADELDLSCVDIDSLCPKENVSSYCDIVEKYFGRYKHILVAYDDLIRQELLRRNNPFIVVIPDTGQSAKEAWFKRFQNIDADSTEFLKRISVYTDNYDKWLQPAYIQIGMPMYTLRLRSTEWLSDKLYDIE